MRLELVNLQRHHDSQWPFPAVLLRMSTRVNGKRWVSRYWAFESAELYEDIREDKSAEFEVLAEAVVG